MKIEHLYTDEIEVPWFEALPGQFWCILGSNRSGIVTFFNILSGRQAAGQAVQLPDSLGTFSFKGQQALFESELKKREN